MAIKTTTDYTGRKLDVSLLQYPDVRNPDAQTMDITVGNIGRFCAGVQKLIQRYTILLLTDLGSQEDFPTEGTSFLANIKNGSGVIDRLAASQTFALANYGVVVRLKEYQAQTDGLPLDEQLASAKLRNIVLRGDYVGFDVFLTTEAGSTADFLVPLPI